MLSWLYSALGAMLSWFNSITGSYALALLLYALVFKLVLAPFGIKQQKNQIKMAKLAPKIELIRAKYKGRNDQKTQQKMQQEIMELQQQEGYSPLSGCLPMLIQFPLIIFLYNVIQNPLSYIVNLSGDAITAIKAVLEGAGFEIAAGKNELALVSQLFEYFKTNAELSYTVGETAKTLTVAMLPNFDLFGMNLAQNPSFKYMWSWVLPFIVAVVQWGSMYLTKKLNPPTAQPAAQDMQNNLSMKIMDLIFPLMTLFMAFSFSGMLGLYWIYQSIFSVLQSLLLAKIMPLPKYTEEEMREMSRQQKDAERAARAALKEQPKYRSLHYIDADDYDELPELKKEKKNTNFSGDIPEIKD